MSDDRCLLLYETSARSLMPATMDERRRRARNIAEVINDLHGPNAALAGSPQNFANALTRSFSWLRK
jgi:hypothetical protein